MMMVAPSGLVIDLLISFIFCSLQYIIQFIYSFLLECLGTFWTASAHIITAVIGSGVLSLAWAIAQLGWIAGPIVMLLFAFISYYTSCLLTDCYRSNDSVNAKRNYTYMHAVRSFLGMQSNTNKPKKLINPSPVL